ncbi:MAG: S1C family serine protease [Chloroflexota bacterium]
MHEHDPAVARRGHGTSSRTTAVAAALAAGILVGAAAAPAVLGAGRGPADTALTSDSHADNETIISVAARLSPSVVTLVVVGERAAPELPEGFEGFGPPDGVMRGTGSGVIVDADGLILTNAHVVDGATEVEAILSDGNRERGEVVGIDTYTDLAVVRIEGSGYPAAELGSSAGLRVGQLAVAIGSPLGEFMGSVSAGIVSGLDRTIVVGSMGGGSRLRHLIQTDAAINPGNSGGVLADRDGRIIGINTAVAGNAEGIGFAIPIDIARPIVEQARAGERIARPWMGIMFQDVDAQVAEDNDLPAITGAWIAPPEDTAGTAVVDGSPAADAGLRAGDIIRSLGGQTIDRDHPLDLVLLGHAPGATVPLTVLRDGEEIALEVTLGTRPADLGR